MALYAITIRYYMPILSITYEIAAQIISIITLSFFLLIIQKIIKIIQLYKPL